MRKFTSFLIPLCGLALLACKRERIDFGGNDSGSADGVGYLSLEQFSVSVANVVEEISSQPAAATRAAGATTDASDDYKVKIRNTKTDETFEYTYVDLKTAASKRIELTPGIYDVSAESPDLADYLADDATAHWGKPVYSGLVTKTVEKRQETVVDDLLCTLANIKATVALSPDLQALFMSDADAESAGKEKLSVTVALAEDGLLFDRPATESGKAGYFKAVEAENTLKITLKGQYNKAAGDEAPDYVPVSWTQEIPNCKAGQWRKISIGVQNADQGNVQFEITVENWVYDEKVEVDVTTFYQAAEETIPDEDISDEGAPAVTLASGDLAGGYDINGSMYDADLNKWSDNLKVLITPGEGVALRSAEVEITTDNAALLEALEQQGYARHTVALWPDEGTLSTWVLSKEESGVVSLTLKDAGMTALYGYEGTHTLRFVTVDEQGRTSYASLEVRVSEGGVAQSGPVIVWKDKSGSKTYDFSKRYNHNEVEIVIDVTSESGFSGFAVDIISDNVLTPSELMGVGLSDHLDLIDPGQYQTQLGNLGFPTGDAVKGQKHISFDISSFMAMLSMLNKEGNCDFRLTVTDASGTTVKTIQLYVVKG